MSRTTEELLNTSIQFERDGFDFYTRAGQTALSDLARGVFEALAQDEKRHIEILKAMSVGVATVETESQALAERLRPIFRAASESIREAAETAVDDSEALGLAIELEERSMGVYAEAAALAGEGEVRHMCEVLVGIEQGHRQLLENVVEYLEHPDSFFLREERWFVEG